MSRIFVLGLERDLRAGAWVSRSVGVPDLRVGVPDLRVRIFAWVSRIFALGVPDLRGSSRTKHSAKRARTSGGWCFIK